jgi:hypothetical protein
MRLYHLLTTLTAVATATPVAAQLARHELRVPGSVQRIIASDVDGDGHPELLVFSVAGDFEPQRYASVVTFGRDTPSGKVRSSWILDREAGVFDVGNDPGEGPSLWYCTASAVRRYRLRDATKSAPEAETWLESPSLLGGRSDEWVVFHDFVGDWHGTGRETPAVFQPGRLILPGNDPSQAPLVLPLRTEIDTTAPPASYEMMDQLPLLLMHRLPALTRTDTDGDDDPDLIAALGDRLAVYPGGTDRTYSTAAKRNRRLPSNADPRDETRRQFIQLADVTGDGRADALLSSLTGGFGNLSHELVVFRGQGRGFSGAPTGAMHNRGAASLTTLADFDGNGRHELVTVTVEIGVRALLTYLLTSRVPIEYSVYRVDADGKVGSEPMMEWTRRVHLESTGATDAGIVTVAGDFDGDGIRDVVSASDDEEIEIRRVVRQGDRFQLADVIAEVAAPGRGQALAPDLNGDRRSDLVVYAPRRPEGVITLFLSSSGAPPPQIKAPHNGRR